MSDDSKKAYRSRYQDWPGFSSFVDDKSRRNLRDIDFQPNYDQSQSRQDAMWPQPKINEREVERALPLPSDADEDGSRTKRIGPTVYNKNDVYPERTLPEKGEEYGHPTKYDYNTVRRRNVTAEIEALAAEMTAAAIKEALRNETHGQENKYIKKYYVKHRPAIQLDNNKHWHTKQKKKPVTRRRLTVCDRYPNKCVDRGKSPFRTPGERTKQWHKDNKQKAKNKGVSLDELKAQRERARKAFDLAVEAAEILGFEIEAANWPAQWNTHTKKTQPPQELDQNYGEGQSRDQGSPRKDPTDQEGESLRAPNLDEKEQKGLKWEIEPRAPGGSYPIKTVNNPGSGSGKVIPMWGDFANNTQAIPDGRQDNYLHNNNFDVKVAATMGDILANVDPLIAQRAKQRPPKLLRTDTKNWIWTFKSGSWKVRVQAFKKGNAKKLDKVNLRLSCSCPFWRWQGPEHWGKGDDYLKGKPRGTAAFPAVRDPNHQHSICKHVYAVLDKVQTYAVRPEKSPLRKLGSRYSLDSLHSIEVEIVGSSRIAHAALERIQQETIRNVAERYLAKETF
jgi:hypothetical protein